MEILAYQALLAAGAVSIVFAGRLSFYVLALPVFIAFIAVVRFVGFDTDVATYASWFPHEFRGTFYWREFLYFFLTNTVYAATVNEIFTYLVFDLAWITVVAIAHHLYFGRDGGSQAKISFVIAFCSFPVLMGFENFYRQHLGTAVATLAYVLSRKNVSSSLVPAAGAILFHNSMVLAWPALVGTRAWRFTGGARFALTAFSGIVLSILIFSIASGGVGSLAKSDAATGLNLAPFYYAVFLVLAFFLIAANEFRILAAFNASPVVFSALVVLLPMITLFQDAPGERAGMILLTLAIPDLVREFHRFHWPFPKVLSLSMFVGLSVPMVVFSSTRNFLLTG